MDNININTHFGVNISNMVENEEKKFELSLGKNNEPPEPLQFDTLFICEGTNRNTISLVDDKLNENGFEFANMDVKPRCDYHATARFMIKPLEEIEGGNFKSYREFI